MICRTFERIVVLTWSNNPVATPSTGKNDADQNWYLPKAFPIGELRAKRKYHQSPSNVITLLILMLLLQEVRLVIYVRQ